MCLLLLLLIEKLIDLVSVRVTTAFVDIHCT